MNTNNNTIAAEAVKAINTQRHQEAVNAAIPLVKEIDRLHTAIAAREESITALRKELVKLSTDKFTLETTLGTHKLSSGSTASVVAQALETLNNGRKASVEASAQRLDAGIRAEQSAIESDKAAIAELVKKLDAIKVEEVQG